MIVYIDQLFIINFAADYIILHISCGFCCTRKRKFIALAALLGGIYGACMYIPKISFLYNPFCKMVSACVMVIIAARPKSILSFLRAELTFAAVASILGGGVLSVLLMLGYSLSEISNNSIAIFNVPSIILTGIFCGVVYIGRICFAVLKQGAEIKRKTVKLTIFACGKKISINGLVDTGCTLRNPTGHEPVIIVNYNCVKGVIGLTEKVCIIPYSTVNGKGSFLGFKPDYVIIDGRRYVNVVVAVRYADKKEGRMYSAIINSDILKEEASIA